MTAGPSCPKCGECDWSKPKYRSELWSYAFDGFPAKKLADERLEFTCVCGFKVIRPTLDAKEQ